MGSEPARIHLGWAHPPLVTAADWLAQRYAVDRQLDLADVIVTVPAARAGRRLLELLVAHAERDGRALVPPRIVTTGALPELLLETDLPAASRLIRRLAWIHALRDERDALASIAARAPAPDDWIGWMLLGDVCDRLHTELGAYGLAFGDVPRRAGDALVGVEETRWQLLARAQARYLERLASVTHGDPSLQRIDAIERGRVRRDCDVVLLGAVDLLPIHRRLLDALGDRVFVLIAAPDERAERFDPYGCLDAAAWRSAELPIDEASIEIVDRPSDQADAVLAAIAALGGDEPLDEIVLGATDASLVPVVKSRLERAGVPAHAARGRPLRELPPSTALDAIARYLDTRRFDAFAALVRHPDVEAWIRARDPRLARHDWLSALDRHAKLRLPDAVGGDETPERDVVASVHAAVEALLEPLSGAARAAHAWADPIRDVLVALYAARAVRADDAHDLAAFEASEALGDGLESLETLPAAFAGSVRASDAIDTVLLELADREHSPAPSGHAVEMLGWLDLPLDDTRCAIVVGMNEGHVPSAVNADPFLPNALRRRLGLFDNDHRYARDAYALELLLQTRARVRLIAGRRDGDGDPLTPSRLLLATDGERAAQRIRRFYGSRSATHAPGDVTDASRGIPIPRPEPLASPPSALRVTGFRDYLACPYRFYLKHIARLDTLDDHALEMDAASFGTLAHAVLQKFGESALRGSTDAREIDASLSEQLDLLVRAQFGNAPRPAVRMQIEQLRRRLTAFAQWQSRWCAEGWQIAAVEAPFDETTVQLRTASPAMGLRGRIDRIDVHAATGEWIVWDYKTGDHAKSPESVHRQGGAWRDLQLPLYAHVLPQLDVHRARGGSAPIGMGYLVLPADPKKVGPVLASWSADELDEALRTAARVADDVRAQRFWPPAIEPPPFSEAFALICQDGARRAAVESDES